jgi:hypothetical protein
LHPRAIRFSVLVLTKLSFDVLVSRAVGRGQKRISSSLARRLANHQTERRERQEAAAQSERRLLKRRDSPLPEPDWLACRFY